MAPLTKPCAGGSTHAGTMSQSLLVLYPWVWVPKPWNNMALNKSIWDPTPKVTNIKGTNPQSLKMVGS